MRGCSKETPTGAIGPVRRFIRPVTKSLEAERMRDRQIEATGLLCFAFAAFKISPLRPASRQTGQKNPPVRIGAKPAAYSHFTYAVA